MTDQPETGSFGGFLQDLELTPSEAAHLLSHWAADFRDSMPTLHTKLMEHATTVAGPPEEIAESDQPTPTDTTFFDASPTSGQPVETTQTADVVPAPTTAESAPAAPMAEGRPATENPQPHA